MGSTQQILHFYGWWELITCAISGAIEIYYSTDTNILQTSNHLSGWRSILSLFNSLFILMSLPWFRHKPEWMKTIIESKSWYVIIGVPFLFALLPTAGRMITGSTYHLIEELDIYFAVFTLIALVFILWESFSKRGLTLLGYLSVIFVLVTLVAQLYKFTDEVQTLILYSAIFKSLLIMIFFALALSWVKDLSKTLQLKSDEIFLSLNRSKLENGKYQNTVSLTGIPDQIKKEFTLTNTYYNLLQKFIIAKNENPTGGWLEIKPKSDSRNISYPIKDYNEIKRLTTSLLDGLYGKALWDKDRHGQPLKEALFEFSKDKGRQIRLKIPAQNISA